MLWVLADYHYGTFSLDYLALITDFLYGRLNFHFKPPFLFCSPDNASLGEVIY